MAVGITTITYFFWACVAPGGGEAEGSIEAAAGRREGGKGEKRLCEWVFLCFFVFFCFGGVGGVDTDKRLDHILGNSVFYDEFQNQENLG